MSKDINKVIVEGGLTSRTTDDREIVYVGVPVGLPADIAAGNRHAALNSAISYTTQFYERDERTIEKVLDTAEQFHAFITKDQED